MNHDMEDEQFRSLETAFLEARAKEETDLEDDGPEDKEEPEEPKDKDQAMRDMECWEVENHLSQCLKHRKVILDEIREKVIKKSFLEHQGGKIVELKDILSILNSEEEYEEDGLDFGSGEDKTETLKDIAHTDNPK